MNSTDLIKYTEKIYGYAIKRTRNRYEAEELSQQIMLEALSSLEKLRDEKAFHGWLWSLANNTYKRWLYTEHRFNYYNISITETTILSDETLDSTLIHKEDEVEIKKEISKLSSTWREIIILHYFEGKSIAEIAQQTSLSEGTIKWRLHEAREKIKKEMVNMKENNYSNIKPIKLKVMTIGKALGKKPDMQKPLPPLPDSYVQNAVAQNIAAAAYEKPATIEEISKLTGIPSYYIEEEIKILVENELMIKKSNRYQTNFVIIKNSLYKEIHNILIQCSNSISEKIIKSINSLEKEIHSIGFYGSNKDYQDLLWTLIPFTFRECENDICQGTEWLDLLPKRSNGGRWYVCGFEENGYSQYTLGQYLCPDESKKYFFNMYSWNNIGLNNIFDTRRALVREREYVTIMSKFFNSSISASNFNDNEKELLAELIQEGYITRKDDKLILNIISMTHIQYSILKEILNKNLDIFKSELTDIKEQIKTILKSAAPKHLSLQLDLTMNFIFSNISAYILKSSFDQGKLLAPINPKTAGIFMYKKEK